MVKQACKDNAPDEGFARRLEAAIRVFAAKGPSRDHILSAWHDAIRDEDRRIPQEGEEGPRIDMALSHSGSRRLRGHTVIRFGLRRDERSLLELARMLEDRSARVRPAALGWYAGRIHPDRSVTEPHAIGTSAGKSPPGIERLLERMPDEKFNVRRAAVLAVGAYRDAGDPCVAQALQSALDDPKHKVAHAAARILGMPCPGCGRTW